MRFFSISVAGWLRAGAASVFLGRAWQHIFWDAPYRNIWWDEKWIGPIVRALGLDWSAYTLDAGYTTLLQRLTQGMGLLDALCAALLIFAPTRTLGTRWGRGILWLGVAHLAFLAFVYCKEHFFHVGQLLEFGLQVALPVAFLWQQRPSRVGWLLKAASALTFICHGLYAMGWYPLPGEFVDMTINGFGLNEDTARALLWWFGLADMVAAVLIWLPGLAANIGLGYMILWGLLTALARVWGHYYPEIGFLETLQKWWFHVLYRLPHAIGPLVLWLQSAARRTP